MPEIAVRPYRPSDRDELLDVVFEAAGEGAPSSDLWGHSASLADVYLKPYLDLEPESAFVATVDDRPAGYLVGCVDDARFPSEEQRMKEAIRRHRLFLRPRPLAFFARGAYDGLRLRLRSEPTAGELSDPRWPSHLHVDLMPVVRGTGAAAGLMELWFARVREAGSPGCYLQTSAENHRAVRYFERMGFTRHGDTPVVPGMRFHGKPMQQQTMVWSA